MELLNIIPIYQYLSQKINNRYMNPQEWNSCQGIEIVY